MLPERRNNLQQSPESLEDRLRALPQPPVPDGLEARLLSGIPNQLLAPRRRWPIWVGVAGVLAAACLLVVLTWPRRDRKEPIPSVPRNEIVRGAVPRAPDDSDSLAAWREAHRTLDGEQIPAFNWPLAETSSVTISTAISDDTLE
jgi:hypothetical protein